MRKQIIAVLAALTAAMAHTYGVPARSSARAGLAAPAGSDLTEAKTPSDDVSGRPSWSSVSFSAAAVTGGESRFIRLANGLTIDTRRGEPDLPGALKQEPLQGGGYGYYIVQFTGPVREGWRRGLESEGARVLFYLPDNAFVVRMNEDIRARIAASKSEVAWTGLYHPAYKISDRARARARGGTFRASILLFDPETLGDGIRQVEEAIGRKAWYRVETEWAPGRWNRKIFADLSETDLQRVAGLRGVCWIEPMPRHLVQNDRSQVAVQNGVSTAGARPIWARGIRGASQLVMDLDTGCRESQYFFVDTGRRKSSWYWDNLHRKVAGQQPAARDVEIELGWNEGTMSKWGDESKNSYHGTHTSGSICGDDSAGGGTYAMDGMAKDARLVFIDGGGDSGSVYGTFDLNRVGAWAWDSAYKYLGDRAYISSNSWGDSSCNGVYDASAMEADQFAWSHKEFIWFFSDGNDGAKNQPGSKAGSPGTLKDGVAVGALVSAGTNGSGGANTKANYSSYGRHADGRLNPTITTPGGANLASSYDIYSADGSRDNGTLEMAGTSMACPIAAGACALLRQYLTEGWYPTGAKVATDGFIPAAALMKALLAMSGDTTSSTHGPFTPDSLFGWGRINLDTVLYFTGNQAKLLLNDNREGLLTGEAVEYLVNIPSGAAGLKVSLCWTDYPGAPNAARSLVNDLDLDVYSPGGGSRYPGNSFDGAPRRSQTGTVNDSVDVLEGVHVQSPSAGAWRIRVSARNVPYGPQPFALCLTYRTMQNAMGKVYLDKPVYGLPAGGVGDTVRIEVHDFNRTAAACSVWVSTKLAETARETVACAKVGDGLYQGKIPLWRGDIVHGDGRLTADIRDTVTALFADNSPAFTDTARAGVDGVTLTITGVYATDPVPPNASAKYVRWTTSEPATRKVYYGQTTSLGSSAAVDTPLTTSHALQLAGLTPSTLYYFDVESSDRYGNKVRDNNGGRHYQFNSGSSSGADVLVVVLNSDLQGAEFYHPEFLTQAIEAGGWTYDWWSTKDQGAFGWNTGPKLKDYKSVFFQVGQENYPPWTVAQKESIKVYRDRGGRFAVTGHDIGWAPWDAAYSSADTLFCKNYLKYRYSADITSTAWTTLRGMSGDPISGSYTGGVSYSPPRDGFAADYIKFSRTGIAGDDSGYVWRGANSAADTCSVRWETAAAMGTSGQGVWGGYQSRVVANAFEITQIDTANKTSPTRIDIINKLFVWLIGHDHPDVSVSLPTTGATYASSPVKIRWTSSVYGGSSLDTTWVEYSGNDGSSWNIISKATTYHALDSLNWDIGSVPNGTQYQVRVRVIDKGLYPPMMGLGQTGNFTLNRGLAGDYTGPLIVPGTAVPGRNPVGNGSGNGFVIQATASDSACGLSAIAAARCSVRVGGTSYVRDLSAADGAFDEINEQVQGNVATAGWPAGTYKVYVRAADNSAKALRWGAWDSTTITVSATLSTPLAVEMAYFSALASPQGVVLSWRTESETNSYLWIVERAEAGGAYRELAQLPAAGNSAQPRDYGYTDASAQPNRDYLYRIAELSLEGGRTYYGPVGVRTGGMGIPADFALNSPAPNPFTGQVVLAYQLPATSRVTLRVYNILGQAVKELENGRMSPGYYRAAWDGRNDRNGKVSAGVYFIELRARADNGTAIFMKKVSALKLN